MSELPATEFAFALCQPGMERALKEEVLKLRPDLRPAFQRPGLVTFKSTSRWFRPSDAPNAIFARAWGCSGGPARTVDEVMAIASSVDVRVAWVGARDAGLPDEVPPALGAQVEADQSRWRKGVLGAGRYEVVPRDGELVLDVITFPGEPALVGWHTHGSRRHPGPAGRWPSEHAIAQAPRAKRKMLEALAAAGISFSGDIVVEIGASPGLATRALIESGARVFAIDPHPLDPDVAALHGVRFVQRAVGDVANEAFPEKTSWIACDAGIPSADAVRAVARVVGLSAQLKGLILTLKLPDEQAVRGLPRVLREITSLGFASVQARQLPAHRREISVIALAKQ